jgi:hypothetical protein
MEQGDLPGAQAAFERLLRDQPDGEFSPVAHLMIGRIHFNNL